jgi:hypothetical protein
MMLAILIVFPPQGRTFTGKYGKVEAATPEWMKMLKLR